MSDPAYYARYFTGSRKSETVMQEMIERRNDAYSTQVDGLTVLLSIGSGQCYEANAVAGDIWNYLDEPRSEEAIVEYVSGRYRVDEARCRADVAAYLAQLESSELISLRAGALPG